jgi:hypothetical protein
LEYKTSSRASHAASVQNLELCPGERKGKALAIEAGKMVVIETAIQIHATTAKSRSSRAMHDLIGVGSRNIEINLGRLPTYTITSSIVVSYGVRGPVVICEINSTIV